MNLTFPHLGIKDHEFLLSVFFGLAAWNFIVCEAGSVLSTIKSKADILNSKVYLQLGAMGAVVAGLAIAKRYLAIKAPAVVDEKDKAD